MAVSKIETGMIAGLMVCSAALSALLTNPIAINKGKAIAIREHKLQAINDELDSINTHKNSIKVIEQSLTEDNAKIKVHINDLGDVSMSFDIKDIAGTLTADTIEPCEPTAPYGSPLQESNYNAIMRRKEIEAQKNKKVEEKVKDEHSR